MKNKILESIQAHQDILDNLKSKLLPEIEKCAQVMIEVVRSVGVINGLRILKLL